MFANCRERRYGARARTRTGITRRLRDFKSLAYTDFATRARAPSIAESRVGSQSFDPDLVNDSRINACRVPKSGTVMGKGQISRLCADYRALGIIAPTTLPKVSVVCPMPRTSPSKSSMIKAERLLTRV
jgi:hypothetical protein